jgi:glucose-1-phosphate cytidylyltransferase
MGTRLAEETSVRAKPMVEVGGKPIVWHIMSIYAHYGLREFVIAAGYKGETIKEYFQNFVLRNSNLVVDLRSGTTETFGRSTPDWRVAVIDTGQATMTGGRLRRLKEFVGHETFAATYGDGVADIDVKGLLAFHRSHGKLATLTAVRPPARFGALVLEGPSVCSFSEKPQTGEGWINGGFFVFEPEVLDYVRDDQTSLEREPLERLAAEGELMAYRHEGFWHAMDTLRDKQLLDSLWESGKAPWKVWP